jgi:hypothetical protein
MENILLQRYNITLGELLSTIQAKQEDCVFLAGSIVESINMPHSDGMGNKLSDIDIFLLTEYIDRFENARYDTKDFKLDFLQLNDSKLDIEIYNKSIIMNGLNSLANLKIDNSIRTQNLFRISDNISMTSFLSIVHRLLTGITVMGDEQLELYKNNKSFRTNYFRILSRLAIGKIESNYDDAIGNLDCGSFDVALFAARNILVETVKVYLFSHQISLDRDKWALLKLRNLAKENIDAGEFFDLVASYYHVSVVLEKDLIENIENILILSNNTITKYSKRHGI